MTSPAAPPAAIQMSRRDWTLLLLLGAIWGGSFFFARIAVQEVAPLTLVMLRVLIAAAALHLVLFAKGSRFAVPLARVPSFFVLALLNNIVPFSLIFLGQTELGAGLAAVLNATTPFWSILIAAALLGSERFSAHRLAGIALGIAGTAVMVGPGLASGLEGPLWPKLALLGASVSYAFAAIFARRFSDLPPTLVATGQLTASSVVMAPLVLAVGGAGNLASVGWEIWAAVLALSLLSTAFAYTLFFRLIATAGSTNTSLVTLIVPASAILLGTLLLGERFHAWEVVGLILILAGLVVIDGRALKMLARSRRG